MVPHRPRPPLSWLLVAALTAACSKPIDPGTPIAPSTPAETSGVAWLHASNDADVDGAFAQATAANVPVFVYWGAKWCPPCNLVKATVFNRQDFIERSRAFVPVYIDGDGPGAQKLGARFHVSGYPTMVLFSPQGAELTRLPGEVDPVRYTEVLTLGMSAQRPVKDVLARALQPSAKDAGPALTDSEWRLLAFYSWDTDETQLAPKDGLPALLQQLADTCPAQLSEIAMRLRLKALAAADTKSPPPPNSVLQANLLALLADARAARAQLDVLTNYAAEITRAATTSGTAQRAELVTAFDAALQRFAADPTLARADRMTALGAQIALARIDIPAPSAGAKPPDVHLSPALIANVQELTARFDREITDGYERQAVIPAAAYVLEEAGLANDADALLESNLAKSHSPYYLMLELASNAQARGDNVAALRWYADAFDRSEGPATRLQWGTHYVNALIELTPQDEARIETVAAQLLTEAAAQPDALYERSGRALRRIGRALYGWNKSGAHDAAIARLQKRVDGLCGTFNEAGNDTGNDADPKQVTCAALLKAPPPSSV